MVEYVETLRQKLGIEKIEIHVRIRDNISKEYFKFHMHRMAMSARTTKFVKF